VLQVNDLWEVVSGEEVKPKEEKEVQAWEELDGNATARSTGSRFAME